MASYWVFLDGRLKLRRDGLRPRDGAVNMNVEIGPVDGFLTLAVTDGGARRSISWAVFGDPIIELVPIVSDEPGAERDKVPERR